MATTVTVKTTVAQLDALRTILREEKQRVSEEIARARQQPMSVEDTGNLKVLGKRDFLLDDLLRLFS